ncbi:MAG TPA: large conductance mechanosensitive channel protein MscL [Polyangiales bacterium]
MSFLGDFKKFAFKGNVVDLAVGVVIGGAFGKIVSALVADAIMPLVALVMPSGDWRASGILLRAAADPKDNVMLKYGDLLGAVIDFLIVALVLFVLISRVVKFAEGRIGKSKAPEARTTKECTFCLEQIPIKATKCRACTSSVS